jgi:hypothetical protein
MQRLTPLASMAVTVILFGACATGTPSTLMTDLRVGDCYDSGAATGPTVSMLPIEGTPVEAAINRVPCSDPHTFEVFGLASDPAVAGTAFPGDQVVFDRSDRACSPLFEAYVGIDYDLSPLHARVRTPSEADWERGDRGFVCSLFDPDQGRLIGSQKGRS